MLGVTSCYVIRPVLHSHRLFSSPLGLREPASTLGLWQLVIFQDRKSRDLRQSMSTLSSTSGKFSSYYGNFCLRKPSVGQHPRPGPGGACSCPRPRLLRDFGIDFGTSSTISLCFSEFTFTENLKM